MSTQESQFTNNLSPWTKNRVNVAMAIAGGALLVTWFIGTSNAATIAGAFGSGLLCAAAAGVSTEGSRTWTRAVLEESLKPAIVMILFILYLEKRRQFPDWAFTTFQSGGFPTAIALLTYISGSAALRSKPGDVPEESERKIYADAGADEAAEPQKTTAPMWMTVCALSIWVAAIVLATGTVAPHLVGSPTQAMMKEIATKSGSEIENDSLVKFLWNATVPHGIQWESDGSGGKVATVTFEALLPHTELTPSYASTPKASDEFFEHPLKTATVTDQFRLERTGMGWRVIEQTRNRDPITLSTHLSAWPVTEGSQPINPMLSAMFRMIYSKVTLLILMITCCIGPMFVFGGGKSATTMSMIIGTGVLAQPLLLAFAFGFL